MAGSRALYRVALCVLLVHGPPAVAVAAAGDGPVSAPGEVVAELYDLVSFEPGGTLPDWDRVRSLFLPQAVIVLRTSREAASVFSLEGFVNDFVTFIEKSNAAERGFTETILRTSALEFGDIAHVLVLYEPRMGDSKRDPMQGVDSFQLVRRDGAWRIAAVVNEIVTPERPVPETLRD